MHRFGRMVLRGESASTNDHQALRHRIHAEDEDAAKGGGRRRVHITGKCGQSGHLGAHPNRSRRLRMRNSRKDPRLTAASRMTPWNKGCHKGSKSKTKRRSPMVRSTSAPKMA